MSKFLQVIVDARETESPLNKFWRVPTANTARALYTLAYTVAQPNEYNGMIHPDDVVCKCYLLFFSFPSLF